MSVESSMRSVHLVRTGPQEYRAENPRGGVIAFGEGQNTDFTPVELLLVALGGCNALTLEALTKRAEPTRFDIAVEGQKRERPGGGTTLDDLVVTIDITFPHDEDGRAMAERVPSAMEKSHQLCTVSQTIESASPVRVVQVRTSQE
ncbi:OsmC family peroxiredoxin [Aeromicrobium sp. 636]|uniref:OsmC family protein n=1 Tax=Aeromicrobium senzhongii TaxID=2663859 RepID=A0A8I0EX00_9ACTN|nr:MULTISPECIES: OsmC family protein [Aeromicrobium]MBC9226817.1 OsmC family protein [Aeromicrobium senzhongii]MCQ3998917.1 OsmC family peroxiredoxin [Aeromicrobium sp. 636]MTB89588.1 OsmC family peroxiredoxin [Aeromicrobium senzhongii]QNL94285.1 OsmC family protein [Aeromicrobium senzhongii]